MEPTMIDAGSGKTSEQLASLKSITQVVYALQALSFMFGITALVGLIRNYYGWRTDTRMSINHPI